MQKLADLKLLLGITDEGQDDLLQLLLNGAAQAILAYCRKPGLTEETFSDALQSAQLQLAVQSYRQMASNGYKSYTEGALSYTVADAVAGGTAMPAGVKAILQKERNIALYEEGAAK